MCRYLVMARIIEPVSKLGSLRVLEKVGVEAARHWWVRVVPAPGAADTVAAPVSIIV